MVKIRLDVPTVPGSNPGNDNNTINLLCNYYYHLNKIFKYVVAKNLLVMGASNTSVKQGLTNAFLQVVLGAGSYPCWYIIIAADNYFVLQKKAILSIV